MFWLQRDRHCIEREFTVCIQQRTCSVLLRLFVYAFLPRAVKGVDQRENLLCCTFCIWSLFTQISTQASCVERDLTCNCSIQRENGTYILYTDKLVFMDLLLSFLGAFGPCFWGTIMFSYNERINGGNQIKSILC